MTDPEFFHNEVRLRAATLPYLSLDSLSSNQDLTIVSSEGKTTFFSKILFCAHSSYSLDERTDLLHVDLSASDLETALRFMVNGHIPGVVDSNLIGICATLGIDLCYRSMVRISVKKTRGQLNWKPIWTVPRRKKRPAERLPLKHISKDKKKRHSVNAEHEEEDYIELSEEDEEEPRDELHFNVMIPESGEEVKSNSEVGADCDIELPESRKVGDAWDLEFHQNGDTSGTFKCHLCSHRAEDLFLLDQHLFRHQFSTRENGLWYFCTVCKQGFATQKECGEHKSTVHFEEIAKEIEAAKQLLGKTTAVGVLDANRSLPSSRHEMSFRRKYQRKNKDIGRRDLKEKSKASQTRAKSQPKERSAIVYRSNNATEPPLKDEQDFFAWEPQEASSESFPEGICEQCGRYQVQLQRHIESIHGPFPLRSVSDKASHRKTL